MSVIQFVSTPKSFEEIAAEIQPLVQKFKKAGSHKATFLCPAHDDKNPSAWIAQDERGWTHAHCSVCGNLRQTFNDLGVFFSAKRNGQFRKKDTRRSYLETLRAKKENREFTKRQLEVLYWGEPDVTLSYDVYPVDGPLLAQRIAHAREHPPMVSPFSAPLTSDGIENTRAIVQHYLQEHRHLDGPFDGLLFSHTSLDGKLGKEARALLDRDVKAVLITPLRNPAKHDERAWQETWLDADGRKITRHFPTGVAQNGRVFYRKKSGASLLVIGEGLESTLTTAQDYPKADVIAGMSVGQFAHLNIIKQYQQIILSPDLEPHGKGLQAILHLAIRWLPQTSAHLFLLRPDGKGPFDPIAAKLDANDLTPEDRAKLHPLFLTTDNLLHPDHPMRQWSRESIPEIYAHIRHVLEAELSTPGSGQKSIIAIGTGTGKSHALAEALPQALESVIASAPTREGRKSLARNLDPDTQEHHGRSETLCTGDCQSCSNPCGKAAPGKTAPGEATPEQTIENPERYCPVYFGLQGEAPPESAPIHVATEPDNPPPPATLGALGFPISQFCNNLCPRGLATLFYLTNGKKGADTGKPLCPHMMKRLEHWYQEAHLTSTHAALNGDPTLFKANGKLRGKVILDEAPELLDENRYLSEALYQLRLSVHYNFLTDQRFYTEPDRDERLEAYQNMMRWIMYMESLLMTGWKNGDIPPMPGKSWDEFHNLVQKFKHFSYVTIFERVYHMSGDSRQHRGPVLLDRLSKAIQTRTLFWTDQTMIAVTRTAIGEALMRTSRKQDITILTATPSLALRTLCKGNVTELYPATPNLHINWIRGRSWSKTALTYHYDETVREALDIQEAAPENSIMLTTKIYDDALKSAASGIIGYWNRDHEGHNRYQTATHMEILGLQMLSHHQYWMMYEATRRLYDLPWQPADEDAPWTPQSVGISYIPHSDTSCSLPENPDFAYFVREYHTIEIVQAIGRLRAAQRLDETLTVNLRCNIPVLPLFGLVINSVDGHSHCQEKVHNRAVQKVKEIVQQVIELGMRPTFERIDQIAKDKTSKGIRYENWRQVIDTLVKENSSPGVNVPGIDITELWALTNAEAVRAIARREGDRIRRREAALPGRGDSPDGEALCDTVRIMDRYRCDSAQAAEKILTDLHKNRHHPGDEYVQALREIILKPIPENCWTEEEAHYA
ncbi:hypothetical protein [Acidithiobacillus ferriphilus]|uniref:hypothetical protein n=1 Tax=Acidithiobacillus ferriphilus TaxID=1689834 RepID=UPI001C06A229|nr:hypothetical protein [Acidithiobacillus ferriphilus]MBU2852919.1 hypothetical protein [Acidithiobacillus ferriphilus]